MITFTLIALKMALWSATSLSVAFVQMQVHQQSVVSYSHVTYAPLEHPVTAIQCWSDDTLMVFSFALGFIPGRDRKQKSQQKEKQQREVCKEHCSVCQHVLGEENRKSKLKIIN